MPNVKNETAPPELAELQATIANLRDELAELQDETDNHISAIERERVELQAEIERLKGGQGEPVAAALPERFDVDNLSDPWDAGWNACIDRYEELNK